MHPEKASGRLSIFLVCCMISLIAGCRSEPRYDGRSLSKWVLNQTTPEEQERADSAIRAIGTNALPVFIKWLRENSGQYDHVPSAIAVLGETAAPAVPELEQLLFSTNELTSLLAIQSLAQIGKPAVPALLSALTNKSYKVSTRVSLFIGDLGTNARSAVPFFLSQLHHTNHFYRERAAVTLGSIQFEPETVVSALTAVLWDPSPAVRWHAINSLGQFGPEASSAVPTLIPFLDQEEFKSAATIALREIAPHILTNKVGN